VNAYAVELQVEDAVASQVPAERLVQLAGAVLAREGQPEGAGLTLVIVDDAQIQALNRDYRQQDRPTDVLSFPAHEGDVCIGPEEASLYLGDVIIALPTASAQAAEAGHPVADELALLVVHGCLHLLGYDHADEAERARMWAVQDEILKH
jgi:probable rRNA maturation factor